jgi:hypothetical protein
MKTMPFSGNGKPLEAVMKHLYPGIVFALFCVGLAATATAATSQTGAPLGDKQSQEVLAAMNRTPTDGHPDQYSEFTGMQRYAAGDYQGAMKYFRMGAYYADKLSQLSIGLMYLNGEGVQKDPVTAFAWTALAAERKYPQFLATRDSIWAALDAQQRAQAKSLVESLYAEYGDAQAMPRMAKVLRWNRTHQTGSMLGFGSESVASLTPSQFMASGQLPPGFGSGSMPACGAKTIGGAPMTGCGNIYVAWRWDPKLYFQERDGEWKGTVSVGALQSSPQ